MLLWREKTGGDDLGWVAKAAAARGVAIPKIVRSRPEVIAGAEFFLRAYVDLAADRVRIPVFAKGFMSSIPGPIPWTAIDRYAQSFGYPVDSLRRILRAVDAGVGKNG